MGALSTTEGASASAPEPDGRPRMRKKAAPMLASSIRLHRISTTYIFVRCGLELDLDMEKPLYDQYRWKRRVGKNAPGGNPRVPGGGSAARLFESEE